MAKVDCSPCQNPGRDRSIPHNGQSRLQCKGNCITCPGSGDGSGPGKAQAAKAWRVRDLMRDLNWEVATWEAQAAKAWRVYANWEVATIQNEKCMRLQLHGIPIDSEIATIQLFNMICCLCIGSAAPLLWQPCFCGNHVFFQHVFCGKMGKICCGKTAWPRFGRMGKNCFGHQVLVLLLHLWLWYLCLRMGKTHILFAQWEVVLTLWVHVCLEAWANHSNVEKDGHQSFLQSILEKIWAHWAFHYERNKRASALVSWWQITSHIICILETTGTYFS